MLSQKSPKKLIKSTKDIEKVIQMMKKHMVDELNIEGISIKITKHLAQIEKKVSKEDLQKNEEALLFHSAV